MSATGPGTRTERGAGAPDGADLPAPLAEVLELLSGEGATSRAFLGGLMFGALFGAAIAGASLVRHRGVGRGNRLLRR